VGQVVLALLPPDARCAGQATTASRPTRRGRKLPAKNVRHVILYGTGDDEVTFTYDDGLRAYKTTKTFEGVIPNLERRWKETESAWMREEIERYQSSIPCAACHGKRLKPEALAVKLDGLAYRPDLSEFSIRKARAWFGDLPATLNPAAERDRGEDPQGDPRAPPAS
jgi:excinuclease ABC subunit A